tara:strand:+ start:268 stop:390 length:123 start_codon:yes stop_codon:yes gene_type:complete
MAKKTSNLQVLLDIPMAIPATGGCSVLVMVIATALKRLRL